MRVALMTGCAQRVLDTEINGATIRLLTRLGAEVVIVARPWAAAARSSITWARSARAMPRPRATSAPGSPRTGARGLDAVVINTSGCGTTVKDYGHMLRGEPLAEDAARVSALAADVSEVVARLEPEGPAPEPLRVAYHAACSLQHGQRIKGIPKDLLKAVGFEVVEPADAASVLRLGRHLQPHAARRSRAELKARKVRTLEAKRPDVIAAGNIGCMMQIGGGTDVPVVHTVQLLDWATGGPRPPALARRTPRKAEPA